MSFAEVLAGAVIEVALEVAAWTLVIATGLKGALALVRWWNRSQRSTLDEHTRQRAALGRATAPRCRR